jgi:CBS domain-containing protein
VKISELLTPDRVRVGLSAPTVVAAALTLVDALEAAGDLADADALRDRIRTGDARDIVDVEGGVALPHYRTTAAARLGLALAVLEGPTPVSEGPQGEARDRARIVALVAAPPDASALHLQAVSTLARALVAPGLVDRVLDAPDADAVVAVLGGTALPIKRNLTAGDVMNRDYASVPADAHLRVAAERMLDGRSRAIPVVGDKDEVLGMVSSRDVLGALLPDLGRDGGIEGTRGVREIMSRSVLCVPEDLPVTDVANMMINKHVEQVPVVREGRLVGVLTRTDIIRNLFAR